MHCDKCNFTNVMWWMQYNKCNMNNAMYWLISLYLMVNLVFLNCMFNVEPSVEMKCWTACSNVEPHVHLDYFEHAVQTLNMFLYRLTFHWTLTKLHVDYFSVNQSLLNISEDVLRSNLTYIFINVSCMHCFSLFSCIFGPICQIFACYRFNFG